MNSHAAVRGLGPGDGVECGCLSVGQKHLVGGGQWFEHTHLDVSHTPGLFSVEQFSQYY